MAVKAGLSGRNAAAAMMLTALLAACGQDAPAPVAQETDVPEEFRQASPAPAGVGAEAQIGTPMADRVATIGLLNKRNNLSQDLEMKPGESRRVGNVIVRLSACEKTAPWELPQEMGAFVQVLVQDTSGDQEWRKVFAGWLFKNAPSINVVEHPIYDVWVKDCAMSFPGDEAPSESASASESSDE